ncbi:MAG: hypothetical protein M3Q49_09830 [Actinomycetota bacterium]|nr:hypothetical protein [Actinomycetota bacterium]
MRACRICPHPEVELISRLLVQGLSPRSMAQRFGGTTRKSLAHHRDVCLPKERNEP